MSSSSATLTTYSNVMDSNIAEAHNSKSNLDTSKISSSPSYCDTTSQDDTNQINSPVKTNYQDPKLINSSDKYFDKKTCNQSCSLPKPSQAKISSLLLKPFSLVENVDHEKEREELLASQRKDTQVQARNKRMFVGMLMGTLQKFKVEETDRVRSTAKRFRDGEKCTETTLTDVHQKLSNDGNSKDKTTSQSMIIRDAISRTDAKLDAEARYKNWDHSHRNLSAYIRTETEPRIFWLPKMHNGETELRLRGTRDYYNLYLAERTAKYRKELDEIDTSDIVGGNDGNGNESIILSQSKKTTDAESHKCLSVSGRSNSREKSQKRQSPKFL